LIEIFLEREAAGRGASSCSYRVWHFGMSILCAARRGKRKQTCKLGEFISRSGVGRDKPYFDTFDSIFAAFENFVDEQPFGY
jgi:hypothetical protein